MHTKYFSLDTILAIISLAISIGGFIPIFFVNTPRRKTALLAIVLTILVVTSGIVFIRNYQHEHLVKRMSAEITLGLNVEIMTFDQLFEQFQPKNISILNESIEYLINSGVVGHKILDVRDDNGKYYRVRGYYLRSK